MQSRHDEVYCKAIQLVDVAWLFVAVVHWPLFKKNRAFFKVHWPFLEKT